LLGFDLPSASDFTGAKIFAYLLFGAIGMGVFSYGRKNSRLGPTIIGVALMAYPYFVSGTLAIYFVGAALTAVLYFWRE
jgi:hypothetical protein